MSGIRTRSAYKTLVSTNIASGGADISALELREVQNSGADSFAFKSDIEVRVISMALTAPPGSESDQDAYIPAATATGAWAGKEGQIAIWDAGLSPAAYVFLVPTDGQAIWNIADDSQYRWDAGLSPSAWENTAGSGAAPTRTTVTLSGSSTSTSIPAGCTHFTFVSETITPTNGNALINGRLFHTSDTVGQTWNGWLSSIQAAVGTFEAVATTYFGNSQSTTSDTKRGISGTVWSPRDGAKKTLVRCTAHSETSNVLRVWDTVAAAANDDDTIRFESDVGTITGTIHIEWYYN